jgi:hypothetical protein
LPHNPVLGKTRCLERKIRHRVHRIVDNDDVGVGRGLDHLLDVADRDVGVDREQVFAGHTGLTGRTGCQDDDIAVCGLVVAVGARDIDVKALDGSGFQKVQTLALRDPLGDVHENDIGEFFARDPVGTGGADKSGPNDGDFFTHSFLSLAVLLPSYYARGDTDTATSAKEKKTAP